MSVEFKILSGARAGQTQRFEQQAVIVVGRHQQCDLRFDPKQDLDVSGRHAELRGVDGKYTLHDHGSTNGTYVNGKKVTGTQELNDGDTITFGAKGPQVEFRVWGEGAHSPRVSKRSTEARIAAAVEKQTKGMRQYLIGAVALVIVGVGAAFYLGNRASNAKIEELQKQIAASDSMRILLQGQLGSTGSGAVADSVQKTLDALQARAAAATTQEERDSINGQIQAVQSQMRGMLTMGFPEIFKRNAPGVAIIVSNFGNKNTSGTGFSLSKDGWVVTNRHNVKHPETGEIVREMTVKFADTPLWLPARLVAMSDSFDIALLKMTREDDYPTVAGIAGAPADASEGYSVVSIGFPQGMSLPMEGEGKEFIAKASLNPGTVSKRTSGILQMDSFAAHGSSGSPVFSASGLVVGVVYGGPRDVGGKIVYAVPSDKLAAFLPDSLRTRFVR